MRQGQNHAGEARIAVLRVEQAVDERAVRAGLEQDREFRATQLRDLASEADVAREAGDDQRRQMAIMLASAAEVALGEIDAALARMDRGTYGVCESCTKAISADRLEVLPASRFCTPCRFLTEASSTSARGRVANQARFV